MYEALPAAILLAGSGHAARLVKACEVRHGRT
jgi:hypothetical protein